MQKLTVLILAAGAGTRMKSRKAKVLHHVGGLPMLEFVVRAAREVSDDVHVVVGHQGKAVQDAVDGVHFIQQEEQLGTGHAVMAARESLHNAGQLLILPGDVPLIQSETLRKLADFNRDGSFAASLAMATVEDPHGYGRIVRRSANEIDSIVEHRDGQDEVLEIREINSGIYVFDSALLFDALERTRTDNAQKEYYLTDVVRIFSEEGHRFGAFEIEDPAEASGINSRKQLARVDRELRRRKCESLMEAGVSILDPETVRIDADVQIGADSVIYPSVAIEGTSILGEDVSVRSFSRITDSKVGDRSTVLDGCIMDQSEVRSDVRIGPYAHLRMGALLESKVRVGNFVEIKKSKLAEGTKAMHLTYLGDAEIGKDVNVGAGTITCNYDGVNKNKTTIEDGVFIGSNSSLVAPIRIEKNAYLGAGSTITEDVPPDSLAIGRGRQVVKKDRMKEKGKKKAKSED
jgi:bifunctional UDP-N-acetylglucosamine pyrophosphorylase/glucosamine-1-phosphate N-acetyltransferase